MEMKKFGTSAADGARVAEEADSGSELQASERVEAGNFRRNDGKGHGRVLEFTGELERKGSQKDVSRRSAIFPPRNFW